MSIDPKAQEAGRVAVLIVTATMAQLDGAETTGLKIDVDDPDVLRHLVAHLGGWLASAYRMLEEAGVPHGWEQMALDIASGRYYEHPDFG